MKYEDITEESEVTLEALEVNRFTFAELHYFLAGFFVGWVIRSVFYIIWGG